MANQNNNKGGQQQDVNQLLKVRREKLQNLQEAGKDPFQITKYNVTHHSSDVKELYNAHEAEILGDRKAPDVEGLDDAAKREVINNDYNERREIMDAKPIEVSIAGRMMFKRVMGKASFCNIQDLKGNIQVYVARDNIGEDSYADFKKSDIGDIYGVKGFAFRTKTGEISIHAEEITLLSKSLQILPEKFHGLTDTDTQIPSEICRPYHESGEQRGIYQALTRYSRKSVTSLQAVISWRLRHLCLSQTQVVPQQDHSRHTTTH